jgi:hypothetical protein
MQKLDDSIQYDLQRLGGRKSASDLVEKAEFDVA